MKTEDSVLIKFLEDLLGQNTACITKLPNGEVVGAEMCEVAFWVTKVLKYYKENKIQIEKEQLKRGYYKNENH